MLWPKHALPAFKTLRELGFSLGGAAALEEEIGVVVLETKGGWVGGAKIAFGFVNNFSISRVCEIEQLQLLLHQG